MQNLPDRTKTERPSLVCAVDARWANSVTTQSDGLLDIAITADLLHRGKQSHGVDGYEFLPLPQEWTRVSSATTDWLNALTPLIQSLDTKLILSPNRTALADLLMNAGTDINLPDHDSEQFSYHFWEFVVSTFFADGMSRVGYARQLSPMVNETYVKGSKGIVKECYGQDDCTPHCKNVPGQPKVCNGPPLAGEYTKMKFQGNITASEFIRLHLQLWLLLRTPRVSSDG